MNIFLTIFFPFLYFDEELFGFKLVFGVRHIPIHGYFCFCTFLGAVFLAHFLFIEDSKCELIKRGDQVEGNILFAIEFEAEGKLIFIIIH